jgi:hypothetical protein
VEKYKDLGDPFETLIDSLKNSAVGLFSICTRLNDYPESLQDSGPDSP